MVAVGQPVALRVARSHVGAVISGDSSIYRSGTLRTTMGRRSGGGSTALRRQIGAATPNRRDNGTGGEMEKRKGAGAGKIS
jgi:hypothetical protein